MESDTLVCKITCETGGFRYDQSRGRRSAHQEGRIAAVSGAETDENDRGRGRLPLRVDHFQRAVSSESEHRRTSRRDGHVVRLVVDDGQGRGPDAIRTPRVCHRAEFRPPRWGERRVDCEEIIVSGLRVDLEDSPFVVRNSDRKSTRLNSSHPSISYAVFCLIKKKLMCIEL